MSYTNQTPNYNFPQYLGTDKPEFINDFNPTFEEIDEQLFIANTNASTADANATQALADAETAQTTADGNSADIVTLQTTTGSNTSNISTLQTNVSTLQNDVTSLDSRVGVNESDIDTLESDVDTAEANIVDLQGRMTTAEADIVALQGEIGGSGTVLWTNLDSTPAETSFAGQTVTLSESISNFNYYEIEHSTANNLPNVRRTTGKIPVANDTLMIIGLSDGYRRAIAPTGTSLQFEDGSLSSATNNLTAIQTRIIGYVNK